MIGVTQLLSKPLLKAVFAADAFGDGSNMLTSNFSNSSLATIEGNGSGFTVSTGTAAYSSNVPKPGFIKSLTMSQSINGQRIDYNMQTGDSNTGVKAYSFWVYTDRHDDDDNLVLQVNLKRQTGGAEPAGYMLVYAWETDRSAFYYDQFDKIILAHGVREVSELAYSDYIENILPNDEYLGEMVREKLVYYPTVTREPFKNNGRLTTLMECGKLFLDLNQPHPTLEDDRFMMCGSPSMLKDFVAILESKGFIEARNINPGHFVIERAFVES